MIKLIIFDLDGVLVNAKDIHFKALNESLSEIGERYTISPEEHLNCYDGLPTKEKLKLLTEKKGLPQESYQKIWQIKQNKTINVIKNTLTRDEQLCEILKNLHDQYKICVASNSITESVKLMLFKTGLLEYIDFFISNEDVKNPKPNSEIFLQCMVKAGVNPKECIILEDSYYGRIGASESGGYVLGIENPEDITYNKIDNFIKNIQDKPMKWQSDNLTVLIPMAGEGKRFKQAGYQLPKPLIEINNKPMIQHVVENLAIEAHYVFIVQKEHYDNYCLKYILNLIAPKCDLIVINGMTEGAACTTLLAEKLINNDKRLILANSDQLIEWDSSHFMYSMVNSNADGAITTFKSIDPKWSFVKVHDKYITKVAEKQVISDIANTGVYYWRKGKDYIKYTKQMISKNIRTNGEFYTAPVYNEAIENDKKIVNYPIKKMYGLGTPEDLENYLISKSIS